LEKRVLHRDAPIARTRAGVTTLSTAFTFSTGCMPLSAMGNYTRKGFYFGKFHLLHPFGYSKRLFLFSMA
jgi:hypothetical protein